MVSFSCENCNDVVAKKKLDSHRSQCRGASFTCLDCMTHFQGTDYRAHTSCISEAQKYEGALYKDKGKRKSVTINETPLALQAYVEDEPENEHRAVALVSAPPRAPSPPPSAVMAKPVNVFDFLVDDETPNASRISLQTPKEQMQMVANAQPLFKSRSASPQSDSEWEYEADGYEYEYGEEPVRSRDHATPHTPAPKAASDRKYLSTDKKRKRQVEELDLTQARRPSQELDEEMTDVDENGRPMLHSGLTGGLNRMLSMSRFPPSPEYSAGSGPEPSPLSPAKRKRAHANGVIIEKRGRSTSGQMVKVRKPRRASDESRPRKHHRSHRHRDRDHEEPKRALKAIEYPRTASPHANAGNQLVVYRSRAEMFLSFVTKGPESEHGYSLNKALKRYHRERGDHGLDKQEEEKQLFKSLRLKKNDKGEVVILVGGDEK